MATDVRNFIEKRMVEDLIGPYEAEETLPVYPSDRYTLGMLWSRAAKYDQGDTERVPDENDSLSDINLLGQSKPSSMGVSFHVSATNQSPEVNASFNFAIYKPLQSESGKTHWVRSPNKVSRIFNFQAEEPGRLETLFVTDEIQLAWHVRSRKQRNGWSITITVVNQTLIGGESDSGESRKTRMETATAFQCELVLVPGESSVFVNRDQNDASEGDEDAASAALLYHKISDFGTGHQCAVVGHVDEKGTKGLKSSWLPISEVLGYREDGDSVFDELNKTNQLSAARISRLPKEELLSTLKQLTSAYASWITAQNNELELLQPAYRATGLRHIMACNEALQRMERGIKFLSENDYGLKAFVLANRSMAMQHEWKTRNDVNARELVWRPFQLGFVILCLESTLDPKSPDRDSMDLLWFPTGGGKTEAYLALIAIALWHRSLSKIVGNMGCVAVMRYTLRLLTAQQFERASAMILAAELIRRQDEPMASPLSIGLWVGGDATPNSLEDAWKVEKVKQAQASPEQLFTCFACHQNLTWEYSKAAQVVAPTCRNPECELGPSFGRWPVATVDEMLYRNPPSLLIGTVDKFAQIATKRDTKKLFNFGTSHTPDLIIQDELHLISGPLGTIAGIYEVALDYLFKKSGNRPKVIGSTATIRKAAEQSLSLFNRKARQFPPPGLSFENSAFAVLDHAKPGRHYLGIPTSGRSAKYALQSVAASVLQSVGAASEENVATSFDAYSTAVLYFNALKDLGGALVLVQDDVPDTINSIAASRGENPRILERLSELTSRVSQREIIEILESLSREFHDERHVDGVLATNMVSVGVDVPRLGLMIVQGLPKSRAEYIQATSRVGRKKDAPGLVITVMNSARNRDRSAYENFSNWHAALYKNVEPTSVTPFAPRAREKALHASLVAIIRHLIPGMEAKPNFSVLESRSTELAEIIAEIESRVGTIDPRELPATSSQIDEILDDWQSRWFSEDEKIDYYVPRNPRKSLMQDAATFAKSIAQGKNPYKAFPTMNNMRTVEPSTPFKVVEVLRNGNATVARDLSGETQPPTRTWRKQIGEKK